MRNSDSPDVLNTNLRGELCISTVTSDKPTGVNTSKLTEVGASLGGDLPSGLKFVQWNARGVCPKTDRFL